MRHDGWDQSWPDIVDKPITASATRCKSFPDGVDGEIFFLGGGDQNSKVNYCWIMKKKKKKEKVLPCANGGRWTIWRYLNRLLLIKSFKPRPNPLRSLPTWVDLPSPPIQVHLRLYRLLSHQCLFDRAITLGPLLSVCSFYQYRRCNHGAGSWWKMICLLAARCSNTAVTRNMS